MPTLRFEGASLEEAVEAARGRVGPTAKIVGANRVRRGGVGGFFSREHVEIEVHFEVAGGGRTTATSGAADAVAPVTAVARASSAAPASPRRSLLTKGHRRSERRNSSPEGLAAEDDHMPGDGSDPLSDLIEEMTQSGPSSVLDLAEQINDEQSHYALAEPRGAQVRRAAPAMRTSDPGLTPEAALRRLMAEPMAGAAPPRRAPEAPRYVVPPQPPRQAVPPQPPPDRSPDPRPAMRTPEEGFLPEEAPAVRTPEQRSVREDAPAVRTPELRSVREDAPAVRTPETGNAPAVSANFAAVLERIAKQVGLTSLGHIDEILPDEDAELCPEPAPVHHASAILIELDGPVAFEVPQPAAHLAAQPAAQLAAQLAPLPLPPRAARPAPLPALMPERALSNLGSAMLDLGFPLRACQTVAPVTNGQSLEAELLRALEQILPPLPLMPRSGSSVIAVVGPRGQVMATARALATDIGAPAHEVALATQRNVWRQQGCVIASPEAASDERRSWRWRGHPSVVAVEMPVRPGGAEWASAILRVLEPTVCWGVAEASHKPEDLAAWSLSLGGLDALVLVDLDGTTTPAAALAASIPVGRLGDQPATAEAWARALCSRLMG